MKRYLLVLPALFLVSLICLPAGAAENATVTKNSIPLMSGPSFIVEEIAGVTLMSGRRVEVVSRTSFTDRLAAVPEDYWYLVRLTERGTAVTGYVHGSVLAIDAGVAAPVTDPPGYAPAPKTVSGGYSVTSAVSERCAVTNGTLTVPDGSTATHFVIGRFDSSFTACPDGGYGSVIGFSVVSAADPNYEYFSYEEHLADDPAGLQYQKDGFYYMDLDPGTYVVTVRGGPNTTLTISYDLVRSF